MTLGAEPTSGAEARTGRATSCPTTSFPAPHQLSPALRFLLVVYVGADWQHARAAHSARWRDGIAALRAWCRSIERRGSEPPQR